MIGSGSMAWTHALAFAEVRKIKRIQVFSPTVKNRETYARNLSARLGIDVVPVASAVEAVKGAQIVSACTDSIVPVIPGRSIEAGAFVTTVKGTVELDKSSAERIRTELGWRAQRPDLDTIVADAWRWHSARPHGFRSPSLMNGSRR